MTRVCKYYIFAVSINQLNFKFMETPYIKNTPILRGEDARRFLKRMQEKHYEDPEKRKRRIANYEMIMKNFEE